MARLVDCINSYKYLIQKIISLIFQYVPPGTFPIIYPVVDAFAYFHKIHWAPLANNKMKNRQNLLFSLAFLLLRIFSHGKAVSFNIINFPFIGKVKLRASKYYETSNSVEDGKWNWIHDWIISKLTELLLGQLVF